MRVGRCCTRAPLFRTALELQLRRWLRLRARRLCGSDQAHVTAVGRPARGSPSFSSSFSQRGLGKDRFAILRRETFARECEEKSTWSPTPALIGQHHAAVALDGVGFHQHGERGLFADCLNDAAIWLLGRSSVSFRAVQSLTVWSFDMATVGAITPEMGREAGATGIR